MARPRVYESTAARVKAYRERKGLKTFTVQIPEPLYIKFEAYLKARNADRVQGLVEESKSDIVIRLIQTQLLRAR